MPRSPGLRRSRPETSFPFGLTADDLYDPAEWENRLKATIHRYLRRSAEYAGDTAADDWQREEREFNPRDPAFVRGIEDRSVFYASVMSQTTDRQMAALVVRAVEEGWGPPALAAAIQDTFAGYSDARALGNARTHMTWAHNFGKLHAFVDLGITWKKWKAHIDERTRQAHIAADNDYHDNPIPMEQAFVVGGESIMHPGEGSISNSANCRCALVPARMPKGTEPPPPEKE